MNGSHRIVTVIRTGRHGADRVWRMAATQPSWVSRAAGIAFLVIIGVPILLLVLLAFLAAVVVFGVLAGVSWVLRSLQGVLPDRSGRQNVRVIERRDS